MYILNNRKGITLVETFFAASIVALVLAGVVMIFAHTVDVSRRVSLEYQATNVAKSRLERVLPLIETNGFASLTDADFGESNMRVDESGTSDTDGDFRRSTTVTTSFSADPLLTRVDVAVEYMHRGEWKTTSQITMSTAFVDAN